MKKLLLSFTILTATFSLATGGDYNTKNPLPPASQTCTAFDSGFELSAYVAASLANEGSDDYMGGGIGIAYFLTENIGVDLNYAPFNYESVVHFSTVDLALRFPMESVCLAPYIIGGGGVVTDGSTKGVWRIGGGIDFRPEALGNIGIFADGTYNWIDGTYPDTTIVRLGLRLYF